MRIGLVMYQRQVRDGFVRRDLDHEAQRSPGVDAVEYRGPSQHDALWLCFACSTTGKQLRYCALRSGARARDQRETIKGELCTYSVCRATLTDSIVHRSNLCQDRATEQAA